MLTLRRRGKSGNWYIRGTVTYGGRTIDVAEFSSGTGDRDAAEHLRATRERELREQIMFGPRAAAAKATISDALAAYLDKPKRPNSSDILRVGRINDLVGEVLLDQHLSAWRMLRSGHLAQHAPAGQDRYRSVLQAAVNTYNEGLGLPSITIRAIEFDNQRNRFLSLADRDRLISCYAAHVQPIATMLAFQGPRTQEALQAQWGIDGVDLDRGTIHLPRTKTGLPRTIAVHARVDAVLRPIWEERGRPTRGHVFLNRLGNPYTDTRDLPVQGGNPISRAHATACRRAGISEFTVHDWRHHWASHCVMAGVDLVTLMRLGGWKSLRMVQRYATVDVTHMAAAVAKLP
jgi:integrase